MRAAFYTQHGGPERLELGEQPDPKPGRNDVVVRVHAAAVGAWDLHVMAGRFADSRLPMVPSCEIAGVVHTAGAGADLEVGTPVYGSLGFASGGLAEYARISCERLARKPDGLSFAQSAALVVPAGTAYEGLVDRLRLKPRETLLVTAASGSVGFAAVQIGAAVGATVVAVASVDSHERLRGIGASAAFDYHDPDWTERLHRVLPDGVDVLFDGAGGETRARALDAVKRNGRAVFIVGAPRDMRPDIEFHEFSADTTRHRLEAINRLVTEGRLAPDVAVELPLERAREALEHTGARRRRGRAVVAIRPTGPDGGWEVRGSANAASIDTRAAQRDQGEAFFSASEHPRITFNASGVSDLADDDGRVRSRAS
jgi:NADPH:quinone reductase